MQASRLCTVRQARIQLATVLSLAVLYNAPKFAEARIEVEVDPADNSTWLMPHHTALGLSRLYNVVYGNVCYTLFLRSRAAGLELSPAAVYPGPNELHRLF